jgi:Tfp pilus assembly protein PilF
MKTKWTSLKVRRALVLGLSTLVVSPGCASMKSPTTWFAKKPADSSTTPASGGIASTFSSASKGITGQVKTMGTAMSSAVGKAKNAVASTFSSESDNSDPTSLANMPTNLGPEIWITNGQLYESQSNFAKALDNYTKALEIEPQSEAALLAIARLYARQKQYSQAEELFVKAIEVKPQATLYDELASVQQQQGKTSDAQVSIQSAIAMEPSNVRFRNNLASMLVSGGRSDEAVQQLQQVFPPAVANYNVAYLNFTNNNLAGAQQHVQVALQADPNLKEARALMERLSGSPAAQSAVAAYQSANQIYRTAESMVSPGVQAQSAVYQPNSSAPSAPVQSSGFPTTSMPTTGGPAIGQPQSGFPNASLPSQY